MTKFLDGPAAGVMLTLTRAPHYLRAVLNSARTWDALDQLDDTPRSDETVIAYEMVNGPWRAHVQRRVNGSRVCGWYEGGEYRMVVEQPADEVLRSTSAWRSWVAEKAGRPLAADGTAAS